MDKRERAIMDWVRRNRPDLVTHFERIFSGDGKYDVIMMVSCVAFEGGRRFQHDNPNAELDDPNIYVDE